VLGDCDESSTSSTPASYTSALESVDNSTNSEPETPSCSQEDDAIRVVSQTAPEPSCLVRPGIADSIPVVQDVDDKQMQKQVRFQMSQTATTRDINGVISASSKLSSEVKREKPMPRVIRDVGHSPTAAPMTTKVTAEKDSRETELVAPKIIAHDEKKQKLFDKYKISKAVQFEFARGITQGLWTWDQVTEGFVKELYRLNDDFSRTRKIHEVMLPNLQPMTVDSAMRGAALLYVDYHSNLLHL
jgi:hypothetical protein